MQLSSQVDLQEIIDLTNSTLGKIRTHIESHPDSANLDTFHNLQQSFAELFNIAQVIGSRPDNTHNIAQQADDGNTEPLAEYALNLLSSVEHYQGLVGSDDIAIDIDELIINIGMWCAATFTDLRSVEPIINAFSRIANQINDTEHLAHLYYTMDEIAEKVDYTLKQDMDTTNSGRPWRVLNLNMGIVATRSHDAQLIDIAYEKLMRRLPADAENFFAEGMQQMDILGYPAHVRAVVEKYYSMTKQKTIH